MVDEETLDPRALRASGFRVVRCRGRLGACSEIDLGEGDQSTPRRCP
jgi:hypothetical protein